MFKIIIYIWDCNFIDIIYIQIIFRTILDKIALSIINRKCCLLHIFGNRISLWNNYHPQYHKYPYQHHTRYINKFTLLLSIII